ncbi:MAG: ubiquinone biosynthesis regulatory protein kinase UbiB [Betaproteobacteria bacterium]|nr:ubiquinone biosynthesis regulatory protein kinase UbiB [Betaproteobacteria bacterium]
MTIFKFLRFLYIALFYKLDLFFNTNVYVRFISYLLFPIRIFKGGSKPENLRRSLEVAGPIFVKFGQMLSTRRDLLPTDIANELAKLQDKVPPFTFKETKKILDEAYPAGYQKIFRHISEKPIASASVAQVYLGELMDGSKVAIKILRPDIERQVKNNIKLLKWVAGLLKILWSEGKRLKPVEVVNEFEKHTKSELNLLLEAGHCEHLGENFKDKKLLIVPKVYWDFCHEKVMVMEAMDGIPISQIDVLKKNKIDLIELSENGVTIFFTQVFRDGFFHADMHPGNIQVAKDGRYVAMDFGIMGTLNEEDKYYLAKNFVCFFNRDYRGVAQAHLDSNWVPSNTSVDEFENAIRAVCEPIFNKPLKEISFGKLLIRLFQTSRQFNMEIQPQLTMLQKTLLNVEGLGRELNPDLDLWKTARPFLEKWLKEQLGIKHFVKSLKKDFPKWLNIIKNLPHYEQLKTQQVDLSNQLVKQQLSNAQHKKNNNYLKWIIAVFFILMCVQLFIIIFLF